MLDVWVWVVIEDALLFDLLTYGWWLNSCASNVQDRRALRSTCNLISTVGQHESRPFRTSNCSQTVGGWTHIKWCRISAINSITLTAPKCSRPQLTTPGDLAPSRKVHSAPQHKSPARNPRWEIRVPKGKWPQFVAIPWRPALVALETRRSWWAPCHRHDGQQRSGWAQLPNPKCPGRWGRIDQMLRGLREIHISQSSETMFENTNETPTSWH